MKKIGFLSFGHWTPSPQSQTRSAGDTLLQSIELAVAAEELGADGAYFRVHHFARQLASPFPLLAAVGAKTSSIEIGTAVIDMRYENPLYMAEDAGAADLISRSRLQLGISRGSPEQVIDGWRYFGYQPQDGATDGFVRVPGPGLPGSEEVEQHLRFLAGGSDSLYSLGMPRAVGGDGAARAEYASGCPGTSTTQGDAHRPSTTVWPS